MKTGIGSGSKLQFKTTTLPQEQVVSRRIALCSPDRVLTSSSRLEAGQRLTTSSVNSR